MGREESTVGAVNAPYRAVIRRLMVNIVGRLRQAAAVGHASGCKRARQHPSEGGSRRRVRAPSLDTKALRQIEARLKRRDVAAFIVEPISINLGVLIPDSDVIRRVRDLCRQ